MARQNSKPCPTTLQPKAHRGVACLQVQPSEVEKQFLQDYLKQEVDCEVFWGDIHAHAGIEPAVAAVRIKDSWNRTRTQSSRQAEV